MEQIIVTHLDGSTLKLQSSAIASVIASASQNVDLLGNDTVNITVESAAKLVFNIGDKVTIIGRDYTLNIPAKETKKGERLFVYDLQFEGVQYDLLRANYSVNVDTTSNQIQDLSGDSLTGDIKRFLDVLISNANRVFPGKWVLGTYPANTETKTLTFGEADSCLSVLQSLCSEGNYNTEFSIDIAVNGVRAINVGATGRLIAYTFQYGKGKGIYELSRQKVSSSNIVTRLNVYGSSKNINTSKYRASKLCLPTKNKAQSYLENATAITKYGIWEQTKSFEEVYPHRTGTISHLGGTYLKFLDTSMNFDLNEKDVNGNSLYLIPGTSAKIHFNTGKLAGYEFEISDYLHPSKHFTIKPFTDENGYTFPSATSSAFQFAIGDKYVILDIYMPQSYLDVAEAELQTAGQNYLDKYSQPLVSYGLVVDSFFLKDIVGADALSNIIWVGDTIPILDSDLEVDKSIRVKSFTRDLLHDYSYNLTIADLPITVSTINRVVSNLNGLDKIVKINNLNDPARARRNYLNSQEILDMVFDTEGDFYTEKIKPLSIDTSMLSVGAKSMQFGLEGTIFQPNYGGNKNRVVYAGGTLTHYAILDGSDNPTTWNISDGDQTMNSDAARYVYAKCLKSSSGGTILFSTTKISVDSDASYYHFLIGMLNSVDVNNTRALALMYGFTTVNGRFIKTGRIQSADGATYFDLDAGEFKGVFKFTSGTSAETAVATAQSTADNIQVGGRNLIISLGPNVTLPDPNWFHYALSYSLEIGKTYILGGNINIPPLTYGVVGLNNNDGPTAYIAIPINTPFVATSDMATKSHIVFANQTGSEAITLTNVKLELGNKSTDWTPATEDVDAEISTAQTAANNAQTAANIAAAAAQAATIAIDDMGEDGLLTPVEKKALSQLVDSVMAEYSQLFSQAEQYSDSGPIEGAYNALLSFVGPFLTDMSTTSAVVRATLEQRFSEYYSAKADLLLAVSTAINLTAATAQSTIDNLTIGGRNTFISTSRVVSAYNGVHYIGENPECPYGFFAVGDQDGDNVLRFANVIRSNGYWTISWDMKGSQNMPVSVSADICDGGGVRFSTTSDNSWKRFYLTTNIQNYGDGSIYNFVDFANFDWAYFFIKNVKIEFGNKPTDWTPAPEDVDAEIATKARKFTGTSNPTTPYVAGRDIWTNGTDLYECAVTRATGAYVTNDFVKATGYDNTQTAINGGLVTTGTLQVVQGGTVAAGVTGNDAGDTAVRFWAGSSLANRNTAPYRVKQNGSVVMTSAEVQGIINALTGSIGGFEIATGRIGVSSDVDGLSIIGSLIKFASSGVWSGIGTNTVSASVGYPVLARHELNKQSVSSSAGVAVYARAKFPDDGMDYWYTRRAMWCDGNFYGNGGRAFFENKYIGQAYNDIIESMINVTHTYIITSVTVNLITVRLPALSFLDVAAPVSFTLEIIAGSVTTLPFRVTSVTNGQMVDNNGANISYIDMAKGDVLLLKYCNGVYYRLVNNS